MSKIPDIVASFPTRPGVYLMKDGQGIVIYVGKALNLKARVSSYFHTNLPLRQQTMRAKIRDVEYIATETEMEALTLEARLIKDYLPRYNVNLKDDKSYPYLRVTAELYPRLEIVRLPELKSNKGSLIYEGRQPRYFGPYTRVNSLRQTIQFLGRIFPMRTCRQPLDGKPRGRPCLNYQMKKCPAPCRGQESVPPENYQAVVEQVIMFLEGKRFDLAKNIRDEMLRASAQMEFERAAALRDSYRYLQEISEAQKIGVSDAARDVLALVKASDSEYAIHMLRIREGRLDWRDLFFLTGTRDLAENEIINGFIKNYYSRGFSPPPEVILSHIPVGEQLLQEWLSKMGGKRVHFYYPRRGDRKDLLERCIREGSLLAKEQFIRRRANQHKPAEEWARALPELVQLTGYGDDLERIEGYDISHLRGGEAVGVMVTFLNGMPFRDAYRCFRIRQPLKGDDIAALKEVFRRRFANDKIPLPGLIMVDGGAAQLGALLEIMQEKGIKLRALSLAKKNEEIYRPGQSKPVSLPPSNPGLTLLQRVRDEAHRFAISYHRKLREKGISTSILDSAPGIGPKRKQALLQYFGSMDTILQASASEIRKVPGYNEVLARKLHDYLHQQ